MKGARTKTRGGHRYAESRRPIVHIHGAFCLSRSLLLRAVRSLRGKLLIRYYNDEREPFDRNITRFCFAYRRPSACRPRDDFIANSAIAGLFELFSTTIVILEFRIYLREQIFKTLL